MKLNKILLFSNWVRPFSWWVMFSSQTALINIQPYCNTAGCQVPSVTINKWWFYDCSKIGMMTMLLIHIEASFLFVVASQVEQWRVKWKSIQLLSSAAPQPSNWWDQSSNKTSFSRLSTWEREEIMFNVALSKKLRKYTNTSHRSLWQPHLFCLLEHLRVSHYPFQYHVHV